MSRHSNDFEPQLQRPTMKTAHRTSMLRSPSIFALALLAALTTAPLYAQVEIERRVPVVDGENGELSVRNEFGTITVRGWNQSEIKVRGRLAAGAEDFDLDVEREGGSVSVNVPDAWLHASEEDPAFRTTLEIYAPAGWSFEVESLNADLDIADVAGAIQAQTVNGSIRVVGPASRLRLESMTGSVTVDAGGAPMELRSVSGTIVARGAAQQVGVETVSGSVTLAGGGITELDVESTTGDVTFEGSIADPTSVNIETFSGSVRLVLPETVRTDFDLQTFSGEIRSAFCAGTPIAKDPFEPFRTLRCSTGGQDAEVEVQTHNGDIDLVTADADGADNRRPQ